MDESLKELRAECHRAADEFLAIEAWGSSKPKVRTAVDEMISGSKLATSSMAWLIRQTTKLPRQAEPARRLHDLVQAISALRAHETKITGFFTEPAETQRKGRQHHEKAFDRRMTSVESPERAIAVMLPAPKN